jgi:hypothetical protein
LLPVCRFREQLRGATINYNFMQEISRVHLHFSDYSCRGSKLLDGERESVVAGASQRATTATPVDAKSFINTEETIILQFAAC